MSQERSQQTDEGTSRRRLLAGGAASWATVALAGCGNNNDTPTEAQENTPTATPTDTAEPTATATPAPQPENYVVTVETGTGEVPEGAAFASACSATRRFVPGMMVVFYVGIYDPETGEQLTDEDLESVVVNVDGGPEVELGWAGDDEENPAQEWGGSYTLPDDISTGSYSYTVEVTDGDANFRTVGILEDSFEVIEFADPTNYVVTTNTYWNGHPAPEYTNGFVGTCAPEREFSQEMDVTFVIGIYDGSSGDPVGGDTLDTVTVESTDGAFDPVDLSFQSGEDTTPQWNGTLETEGLSAGTYGYQVVVSGSDANFTNVGIASNQFTIIEV